MNLHILGIGGTFMAGLALIAREAGHRVSGSDQALYPPMSTQLGAQGIAWREGYDPAHLGDDLDCVVIGNALSRGNPVVEHVLNARIPHVSGPQWLADNVLAHRRVLAGAGTHGKTTTTSLLAWILEAEGRRPGFLIGGMPGNFPVSARLGQGAYFVIEADEYDTAFFDKRAKFVHYAPEILVLNNLEFDHADIYPDLPAIQRQFHHLVRTVPGNGRILSNAGDAALAEVLAMGCWSPVEYFDVRADGGVPAAGWQLADVSADATGFVVHREGVPQARVDWMLPGVHNAANALAALAAAAAAGVQPGHAAQAIGDFRGVRRRLEVIAESGGVRVYDDFAHHPTEIRATLAGLRSRVAKGRVVAVFEPRSNSMRMGVHAKELAGCFEAADQVVILGRDDLCWDPAVLVQSLGGSGQLVGGIDELLGWLKRSARPGDHVVFLSNGSFDGAPARFARALSGQE